MITVHILLILILLALSAYFSGTETAIFAMDPIRAKELKQRGGGALGQIYRHLNLFLTTVLLLNLLANVGINVIATVLTVEAVGDHGEYYLPITGVAVTAVIVALSEITPKVAAVRFPAQWAQLAAWPFFLLMTVLRPVVAVLVLGCRVVQRHTPWKPIPHLMPEELQSVVAEAVESDILSPSEGTVLGNIITFRRRPVREFMTPRTDIVSLPVNSSPGGISQRVQQARFGRMPVTEENDIDSVIGCVHVKELLLSEHPDLRSSLRPVYYAPECMVAGALFQELLKVELHLAIIVDEYGQVAGLVSVHDLIEELMGEYPDEYTPEAPWVARKAGEEWILNGTVRLETINQTLGIDLPSGREQTLGGFLFHVAGHLPTRGETIRWGEWEFTVQVVRRRRIAVARMRRGDPS